MSRGDLERQGVRPGLWLEIASSVEGHFEALLSKSGRPQAEQYLEHAHAIFDEIGLRGPCRFALGKLAEQSLQFGVSDAFTSLARRELLKTFDYTQVTDPFLKTLFTSNELRCWSAARELVNSDPALAKEMRTVLLNLVHDIDVSWERAPEKALWQMYDSASQLAAKSPEGKAPNGGALAEIRTAGRYLSDFLFAILKKDDLHSSPEESPIRAISCSATAAVEEYLDLAMPDRQSELERYVATGDAERLTERGTAMVDCLGRSVCRLDSLDEVENVCSSLMAVCRGLWAQLRYTPPSSRDEVLGALALVVTRASDGITLALARHSDSAALVRFARNFEDELAADSLKHLQAPASSVAPLWIVVGRAWEQVWEVKMEQSAGDAALQSYLEATRLLIQRRNSLRGPLSYATSAVERLSSIRPLESQEKGYLELALGNLAFRTGELERAAQHFSSAAANLGSCILDPEVQGLQNLTLTTARAFEDAAETASRLGDLKGQVQHLQGAVRAIESTAPLFKIDHSRRNLLTWADKYRGKLKLAERQLENNQP